MTSDSASRVTRSSRDLAPAVARGLACAAGMTVLRAQDASPPAAAIDRLRRRPRPTEGGAGEPGKSAADDGEKVDFPDAPTRPTSGRKPPRSRRRLRRRSPPRRRRLPRRSADAPEDAATEEEGPPPDAAPRTPGVVGSTPGHFEPTEKVRADFDVSFPVDI